MKVLIVHPQMSLYGGAETVIVHLAKYLNHHGVSVSVLTLSSASHPEYEGLEIITPSGQVGYRIRGGGVSHIAEIIGMMRKLRKLVVKYIDDFDVVNPHNFPAVWTTPHEKPIVWMCNEVPDLWHLQRDQHSRRASLIKGIVGFGKIVDRHEVNRKVDEAVVSDIGNARVFMRRYGWYPQIIHYGIEEDIFAKKPSEIVNVLEKFGLDDSNFHIIQVGMISPSKNQLTTLKAINQLKEKIPEIKVIFAGYREEENPYTKTLDEYIRENNLASSVLFTGHVTKTELCALYHASHAAVFSGGWQGSWLSPFEALLAEKPVIVSPTIICSSMIRDQNIGLVSDDLQKAIFDVYEDYAPYLKMARKGKKFVLNNLTWENFCEQFTNILYLAQGVNL